MQNFFVRQFRALKASGNHWLRKIIGVLLVLFGLLGFLPVVGYWMIPLGLALLAVDWPWARRLQRKLVVWWGRLYQRFWPPARRKAAGAARDRKNSRSRDTHNDP